MKVRTLFINSLYIFFAVSFFLVLPAKAETENWEESYFKANQAYREGRFNDAVKEYRRLIEAGRVNGHIYYNLGNAYFKENTLGQAILSYERSRYYIPRDEDLNFNLRYALDQTRDAILESRGFISQSLFWVDDFTLKELLAVFAILNALLWGILTVRRFIKPEWSYYSLIFSLIFWSIVGLSFSLKWYQFQNDDRAVILQEEVNILSGPDEKDTLLFKLHEGSTVHHERTEDGWALIHLPDKKRGWIKSDAIALIKN